MIWAIKHSGFSTHPHKVDLAAKKPMKGVSKTKPMNSIVINIHDSNVQHGNLYLCKMQCITASISDLGSGKTCTATGNSIHAEDDRLKVNKGSHLHSLNT